MRYQNKKEGPILNLKNRWADNGISPLEFYTIFYRKHAPKYCSYQDFLYYLNTVGTITPEMEKAIDDFWEVSE